LKVKDNNMKNTIAILGVTALLVSAAAPQLQAGNVSLSFGAHFPLPLPVPIPVPVPVFRSHVVHEAPPVYVQSAPVTCAPVAPVARYYVPPPVVVYAPPVRVAPPVFYAPAPCYAAPAFGFNFRWGSAHHGGHDGHYHH